MPGLGTHLLVLDEVALSLGDIDNPASTRAGELLRAHRQYAALGAVAQDLLYFAPDQGPRSQSAAQILVDLVDVVAPFVKFKNRYIDPFVEKIGVGLDTVTLGLFYELLKTAELLCANVEVSLEGLVGRSFDPWESILPPPPIRKGYREVAGANSWFWGDMAHYRCTGRFAQTLLDLAGDPELEAFALGSATHIATDVAVHPLVNAIVGGPYRSHAHRHHFVENFLDTLAWERLAGSNVLDVNLADRLNVTDGKLPESGFEIFIVARMPNKVARLLVDALRASYPNPPLRIPGGYLGTEDVQFAYKLLLLVATLAGHKVEPPPFPPTLDFPTLRDLLDKLALDPPPGLPSLRSCRTMACAIDLFQGILEFAKWATVQIAKIAALPAAVLLGFSVDVIKYVLHLVQTALYHSYRSLRRTLVWLGLAIPYSISEAESLDREYRENLQMSGGRSLLAASLDEGYPRLSDSRGAHPFHHLPYPQTGTEEPTAHASLVYGDALATVLRGQRFDVVQALRFLGEPSPEGTEAASSPSLSTPVPSGAGNAIDFSGFLIRQALSNRLGFHDWNMDADRGYGWRAWSWRIDRPVQGSPGTDLVEAFYTSCETP
jgi:hypothetical protein